MGFSCGVAGLILVDREGRSGDEGGLIRGGVCSLGLRASGSPFKGSTKLKNDHVR